MELLGYRIFDSGHILLNTAYTNKDHMERPAIGEELPDLLLDFLRAVCRFGITHKCSPSYSDNFGRGRNVMYYEPIHNGAGRYGTGQYAKEAHIFGEEVMGIKVSNVVAVLNQWSRNEWNFEKIMSHIERIFETTLYTDRLVLAPRQYRIKIGSGHRSVTGYYTIFSRRELIKLIPEFENLEL